MQDTLERGEQVMLLLNRRGFENFWMCRACGKTLDCPHCSISLTYHKGAYRLRCHLCGFETGAAGGLHPTAAPSTCGAWARAPSRSRTSSRPSSPPPASCAWTGTPPQRRGSLEAGLLAAEHGEVDILVGTQMLAKGHTFPKLTLVGILNADLGLKIADFRAAERTFQLLTQVAGRAGRAELPGRVILQTYSPEHPAIVHAVAQNFDGFAESELPYRQGMGYPPFAALSLYRSEGETPEDALEPLQAAQGAAADRARAAHPGSPGGPHRQGEGPLPHAADPQGRRRGPLGEALRRGTPGAGGPDHPGPGSPELRGVTKINTFPLYSGFA